MKYELPLLHYSYDALEPYIDGATMEIHYAKHHQAYADKMNGVLERYPDLTEAPEELMKKLDSLPFNEVDRKIFKNNGGGYINHSLFWQVLDPANVKNEALAGEIAATFASLAEFKKLFSETAKNHFGSGWAWLVRNKAGQLEVYSTPNQDSPLLTGALPLLCLDVWEHAYYLKYQNRRPDYIEAWWNTLKLI